MSKTALITGAGRGIGFAIAEKLAESGISVAINDIDNDRAQSAVERLMSINCRATAVPGDVSDPHVIKQMLDRVADTLGPVNILVNNAGICFRRKIEEIEPEDWDRTLGINLKGVFLCCRAAVPAMKQSGWGRIVNVASISGKIGGLMVGLDYTASKGGVLAFTKGLARELASHGITVNAVCPAMVDTDMGAIFTPEEKERYLGTVPLRRLASVQDVAGAVAYLVSEDASYVTGEVLDVNGGLLMD